MNKIILEINGVQTEHKNLKAIETKFEGKLEYHQIRALYNYSKEPTKKLHPYLKNISNQIKIYDKPIANLFDGLNL